MAFHVRDPVTDALVRKLARERGMGITETIREVVENDLVRRGISNSERATTLEERLRPLLQKVDALPRTGEVADKKFFDDLWGEGGS